MIITCEKCSKKFNLEDSLIPDEGRELQCGSCSHKWFFKKKESLIKDKNVVSKNVSTNSNIDDDYINNEKTNNIKEKIIEIQKDEIQDINKNQKNKKNPKIIKNSFVLIISIAALIVLLDTFKFQLNNYIPKLDLILNNLYESLKDISLFFKDLIN